MRPGVTPHAQSARGGQDSSRNAGSNGHPQHHSASIAAALRSDNHVARRWDNPSVTAGDIELPRRAWDAYARGDIDAATAVLHPTHQPPEWGEQPDPHGEVVTVRDGKVVEMLVYPTVEAALAAAGTE